MLPEREYPGVLREPASLGREVLWRQRVTAFWGEGERRGFDAAVQCQGDTLTVLGLSPTGSMGFAIVLEDGQVELTNHMPERIPFPPRYVLLDVQRAFYPWLPQPDELDAAPRAGAGLRQGVVDGEVVSEVLAGGRLVERSFRRLDGEPPGTITIRYDWTEPGWDVPSRVELENGWYGYRLEIETHEVTALAHAGAPAQGTRP